MAARIRKGDTVEVLCGKSRGQRGRVLRVLAEAQRVVVERVNLQKRHQRPTATQRQGGIIEKEGPIHLSNVSLVHKGAPTRVAFRTLGGRKVRWSVKHGEAIDE